jgi:hypothetical protein
MLSSSTVEQVSALLRLDESASEKWEAEDLRQMVQHQMAAPLEFDLCSVKLSEAEQQMAAELLNTAGSSGTTTFGDLFRSPTPPLELLRLSQKFFKTNLTSHRDGSPEYKVAYVFYLLSIVAARVRHGVKISRLPDKDLLHVIKSVAGWSWIDEEIRQLLAEGKRRIQKSC